MFSIILECIRSCEFSNLNSATFSHEPKNDKYRHFGFWAENIKTLSELTQGKKYRITIEPIE
jgi:hypothetical protein